MLKAVRQENRDLTDSEIELPSGGELSGVEIVITNRINIVTGQVTDEQGAPVADATVVIFADDEAKWFEGARHVRAARPDQQGQWRVKGLPSGEYRAIAPEYVEDGAWDDPDYLRALRDRAQRFTMADGGSQTLALKVYKPN
jgi:Carboxypeptidase regulatory-like domain